MKKLLTILVLTAVFGLLTLTFQTTQAAEGSDDCCCIERNGQLVCTITNETLNECCCA